MSIKAIQDVITELELSLLNPPTAQFKKRATLQKEALEFALSQMPQWIPADQHPDETGEYPVIYEDAGGRIPGVCLYMAKRKQWECSLWERDYEIVLYMPMKLPNYEPPEPSE